MKQFKNLTELEKDIKKNGTDDYYKINGVIYTMDYYDNIGELITFGNKKTLMGFSIETNNRYGTNKFKDAQVIYQRDIFLRNDINYME